jgi:hypothetical protein
VGREAVTNVAHVFRVLADAVLLAHFGVVVFLAGGLAAIVVGNRLSWRWVNRRWFRLAHLAAVGVVVAANCFGAACPLTTLESWLRRQASSTPYAEGFVQHWVERLLYYQGEPWVLAAAYAVFGFLVGCRRRAPGVASLGTARAKLEQKGASRSVRPRCPSGRSKEGLAFGPETR